MNRLLTGLVSTAVLAASFTVSAAEVVAKIERTSVGGWDLYYTMKVSTNYNPANCPKTGYWFYEKTNEFKDAWLSIAMSAQLSNTDVSAYVDDNVCLNGYPKLRRLTLGGAW